MMKMSLVKYRTISFLLFSFMAVAVQASPVKYHLSGHFPDSLNGKKIILYLFDTGRKILDSTYVRNGQFMLSGTYQHAGRARIVLYDGIRTWNTVDFALENTPVTFTYDGRSLRAKGGPLTELQQEYECIRGERNKALSYRIDIPSATEILMGAKFTEEQLKEAARINAIRDSVNAHYYAQMTDFVWRNKDNAMGGQYFDEFCMTNDVKAQDSLLACAGEEFFSNPRVAREIATRKQTPGQPYTDFEMTDKEGNKHSLSEYIGSGRYVLVDIWASWCLGCRLEIPHIQAAYDKYKDKGLDVVLVSIDTTEKPWLNAIEKDKSGSLGHHLLDVKSASMKAYGLSFIPFNILVDPQGKIVAKELRNEKLDEVLQKLLLK